MTILPPEPDPVPTSVAPITTELAPRPPRKTGELVDEAGHPVDLKRVIKGGHATKDVYEKWLPHGTKPGHEMVLLFLAKGAYVAPGFVDTLDIGGLVAKGV